MITNATPRGTITPATPRGDLPGLLPDPPPPPEED
jgi:hypothetical protein